MSRSVEVDWLKRPGKEQATAVRRDIGWAGLQCDGWVRDQLPHSRNADDLTEGAAIGVAALLISDLEKGTLQSVLPIGSGGDYLLRLKEVSCPIQIEMSGLREDETGSASRSRLGTKSDQVLTHARVGFVSVTTFSHGSTAVAHSYLYYVRRQKTKAKPGKRRKK
jgi:hypothetical protein